MTGPGRPGPAARIISIKPSPVLSLALLSTIALLSGCTARPAELAVPGDPIAFDRYTRQWEASYHARSMDSEAEIARMNVKGCAHCHSATGFHHKILSGNESAAPYENVTGRDCTTCHLPWNHPGDPGGVRIDDITQACTTSCHDEVVASTATALSWCSQGDLVAGTGGAEFEGIAYGNGVHSDLPKNCVSCHMAAADSERSSVSGGHTFRVISKDTGPRVLNPAPCLGCHGSITLSFVESFKREIADMLEELARHLPQKPVAGDGSGTTEPCFPADPDLDEVQSMASFNYWMVAKDGTAGVHNPVYARQLLDSSIEALQEARRVPHSIPIENR